MRSNGGGGEGADGPAGRDGGEQTDWRECDRPAELKRLINHNRHHLNTLVALA